MNCISLINTLGINVSFLDVKKNQTGYKIKYVSSYIKQWLYVVANSSNTIKVNFIDCMCNAGIYSDGDLTTAIEVFLLFCSFAENHKDKMFNLFLNDYSSERIEICRSIINSFISDKDLPVNVSVHFSVKDVNEYLSSYEDFDGFLLRSASTVFFVDPYDLGTVQIEKLVKISQRYYCEILFNVFTSDYVRNKSDERIKRCLQRDDLTDKDDLLEFITSKLKCGKAIFSFTYEFRNIKNTELYRIIFVTPHPKGLEKIKDALWETFEGREFFRSQETREGQMSLFTDEMEEQSQLDYHSSIAKRMICSKFQGCFVDYADIELFILERTMLKSSDLLSKVIKPLLSNGIIEKGGIVGKANYRQDRYRFIKEYE